jgi:glucose-6-phosphate isomerase
MLYRQDVAGVMATTIGRKGALDSGMEAALKRADRALVTLRRWHVEGHMPLLQLPSRRDDLAACRAASDRLLKTAKDVVLLGTGGSSLGAQALAQFAGWRVPGLSPFGSGAKEVRFHFFDNLDPFTMQDALKELNLKTTRVLAVSKSGGTPETVIQLLVTIEALQKAGADPGKHVVVLTEPDKGKNAIRQIAEKHSMMVLDHDPGVGGRYSVLSNVGMLPAIMFGLDPQAIRKGAAEVLSPVLQGAPAREVLPAIGAAAIHAVNAASPLSAVIMMPYSDRLRLFSAWFAQLWAESLGKQGKGTQPVAAAGPVDQHSQMQLFLDGPADKLLTLISVRTQGEGPRVAKRYAKDPLIGYLAGRTVGDLTACQAKATAQTFIRNGRPVRTIEFDTLDDRAIGALLMHFMLETILSGLMMDIDPFDQPAVEQGKVLTREYLAALA